MEREACVCLASGMAAATAIFLTNLSAGDHVIVSDVSYAGVAELARDTLPRFGIDVSLVDLTDLAAVQRAVRSNTKLIHSESPANPIMRLADLRAISDIAHAANAKHSCDATFASPLGQDSAGLGVDYVMHSMTKYIGGHGDAVGGAVLGRSEDIKAINIESGHSPWWGDFAVQRLADRARCVDTEIADAGHMRRALWPSPGFLEDHPKVTSVCSIPVWKAIRSTISRDGR